MSVCERAVEVIAVSAVYNFWAWSLNGAKAHTHKLTHTHTVTNGNTLFETYSSDL